MRRAIEKRRLLRRLYRAHQMTAGSIFNSCDGLVFGAKKARVIPDAGPPHHQMSVVVCEALSNPESAGIRRAGEIPWSKFDRPQSFYFPNVEEFMRDSIERAAIHARLS